MRRLTVSLVLLVLVTACTGPSGPPRITKPNVLIVVSDDERIQSEVGRPFITQWFQGGTNYTHAFATTPDCCPSRASMFTGQYAHNHRVFHPSKIKLFQHEHTWQFTLHGAGYHTGFSGKFLNTWPVTKHPPYFDKWTLGEGYTDTAFGVEGQRTTPAYGPSFVFDQGTKYIDDWKKTDSKPWALEIAPSTPHEPFTPEAKYANLKFPWSGNPAARETDRSDKPAYVRAESRSEAYGANYRQEQLRALRSLDDQFRKLIEHLRTIGELDRTVVIYISDNGVSWGEHGLSGKAVPYLPAVRVPLLMRGPGVPTGVNDHLVANIDLAPTIYDLTGVKPTYEVDGRTLLHSNRSSLLLEFHRGRAVPDWSSLVTKTAQYTEYANGVREYYDLISDPYELQNRPRAAPAHFAKDLNAARLCNGSSCP